MLVFEGGKMVINATGSSFVRLPWRSYIFCRDLCSVDWLWCTPPTSIKRWASVAQAITAQRLANPSTSSVSLHYLQSYPSRTTQKSCLRFWVKVTTCTHQNGSCDTESKNRRIQTVRPRVCCLQRDENNFNLMITNPLESLRTVILILVVYIMSPIGYGLIGRVILSNLVRNLTEEPVVSQYKDHCFDKEIFVCILTRWDFLGY